MIGDEISLRALVRLWFDAACGTPISIVSRENRRFPKVEANQERLIELGIAFGMKCHGLWHGKGRKQVPAYPIYTRIAGTSGQNVVGGIVFDEGEPD